MEILADDEDKKLAITEPLLGTTKGGFRTIPFIIANETFEKVASYGLSPNMITYLLGDYHLDMTTGSNMLFIWSAATNLAPVVGAFFADSFFGRFSMIGFGCIFSLLGTLLLWLTAVIPQARPPTCDKYALTCTSSTSLQIFVLCSSFGLLSLGAGGIRSSSLAFGTDQLNALSNLIKNGAFETYLSWYYIISTFAIIIAMTCITYIQENMGWGVGFGVPLVLMFLSALSFFMASSWYVKLKAKSGSFKGFVQVIVASFRRRHLVVTRATTYYHERGSVRVAPNNNLRFLNKACIFEDPQQELTPLGKPLNSWNLSTVDEVEDLKSLIRVIPLWSTGAIMSINIQGSFTVLQAYTMDRHLTKNFSIPAASFGIFMIISLIVWMVMYNTILLPLASKITKKPVHIGAKHRMGIGLFFSFLSMVTAAIVEFVRRKIAINEGFTEDPKAVIKMSAFWLIPQSCLTGLGESFNMVGQNEFFMSELPKSMLSVSSNLSTLGLSVASLLASLIFNVVDGVSKRGGNESWVSSNINKGHYDYYCWVIVGINLINCFYYIFCCKAYGPCKEDSAMTFNEVDHATDEYESFK